MRFSIRSQIIFLVVALMVLTITPIIMSTTKNLEVELRQLHVQLAQDALNSALQTIDTKYQELVHYEVDTIVRRRELMANISRSVLASFAATDRRNCSSQSVSGSIVSRRIRASKSARS